MNILSSYTNMVFNRYKVLLQNRERLHRNVMISLALCSILCYNILKATVPWEGGSSGA